MAFATYNIIGRKKIAKFANLKLVIDFLSDIKKENPEIFFGFFIICDSTLRYKIDRPDTLENLIQQGKALLTRQQVIKGVL